MARKAEYKTAPAQPINQWVRDALAYAGISQAALAKALHERGAISAPDRSIVQKMTVNRDVSADEAFAISEITALPTPNEASRPEAYDEILRLLPNAEPSVVDTVLTVLRRGQKAEEAPGQ